MLTPRTASPSPPSQPPIGAQYLKGRHYLIITNNSSSKSSRRDTTTILPSPTPLTENSLARAVCRWSQLYMQALPSQQMRGTSRGTGGDPPPSLPSVPQPLEPPQQRASLRCRRRCQPPASGQLVLSARRRIRMMATKGAVTRLLLRPAEAALLFSLRGQTTKKMLAMVTVVLKRMKTAATSVFWSESVPSPHKNSAQSSSSSGGILMTIIVRTPSSSHQHHHRPSPPPPPLRTC